MRILIVAGGTGGHIFPALTIVNDLDSNWNQHTIVYDGSVVIYYVNGIIKGSKVTNLNTANSEIQFRNFGEVFGEDTGKRMSKSASA